MGSGDVIMFKKAIKQSAKLRMSISGPSGSGKTFTSLLLAKALAPNGKIAVVDTEHGSASKYADQFEFDVVELSNFHPNNYIKAIKAAVDAGYDVVILDSLTHAWNGPGGILSIVNQNFGKWKDVQPIEQSFIEALVSMPIHVIATMRAKVQYEVEKDANGKPMPKKIGMGAIQRDGIEYEFDIAAMLDNQNTISIEKTRCPALQGQVVNRPDATFMAPIIKWLAGASIEAPSPEINVVDTPAFKRLMAVGTETFGEDWNDARPWLIERYTKKATPNNVRKSSKALTADECTQLADALSKNATAYSDAWHKTKQTETA